MVHQVKVEFRKRKKRDFHFFKIAAQLKLMSFLLSIFLMQTFKVPALIKHIETQAI